MLNLTCCNWAYKKFKVNKKIYVWLNIGKIDTKST